MDRQDCPGADAAGVLIAAVVCASLGGCGGDTIATDPSADNSGTAQLNARFVPQLPDTPYPYSDAQIDLPNHFTDGSIAATDNTPQANPVTNDGATLGRVLFYDTRLSVNDTVACASCHQQAAGFADPDRLSTGFQGGLTERHSMSLSNARYYTRGRFFWDERAVTLEDQVLQPIESEIEMGMDLNQLGAKLGATDFYPPLFEAAFGSSEVNSDRIARALAQFVRALSSYNAKFDRAFADSPDGRPDFAGTFTAREFRGFQLFTGAAGPMQGVGCARCHSTDAQVADDVHNTGLDSRITDAGAGGGRFKVPSLRNVEMSAPYMHDGRFATLEEVVEFYNSGVQANPGLDRRLRGPDGQPRRLNLSEEDKAALVDFLTTLTDFEFLSDPRFSDPF